jgi:hypothetical protein
MNKCVSVGWFRRESRSIFKQLYPAQENLFVFSSGWFIGFQKRHQISQRRVTKKATKVPAEYIDFVNKFLRFIKRVSQLPNDRKQPFCPTIQNLITSPKRRFPTSNILNLDETPIPFEFNSGYTYEETGARSVLAKSDRSGWDKRQATLILYIWADGIQRIKPKLIFHGTAGPTGRIYDQESHLYSPDVTVEFNRTAYNNEELFSQWLEKEYAPVIDGGEEVLLVMDVTSFHKTEAIKKQLRELKTTLALIPPGLTSLLQPLDTAINAPFKIWLEEFTDTYVTAKEQQNPSIKWSVSDRRIMTTWTVAQAARRLKEKNDMVRSAFIQTGISIRPDGSQDYLIRIKDVAKSQICWTGWEQAEDGTTITGNEYGELPITALVAVYVVTV